MLTAGLSLIPLGSAGATTTPSLAIDTAGDPCASGVWSLAEGDVGVGFETYAIAAGGLIDYGDPDGSYVWAVTSGSLPAGLTLSIRTTEPCPARR